MASRLDSSLFEKVRGESFKQYPYNKPYRYVPPQRVGFLRRFCLKTGLDFAQFGLESGMVSRKLRVCRNV